jgi:hypothetical protein
MSEALKVHPKEWDKYAQTEDVYKILVTPELASWILEFRNYHNVTLENYLAKKYAAAMVEGEWYPTKTPIQVRSDGHLIDGQTRLKAVEISDMPRVFYFMFGVPNEAFLGLDIGRKRFVKHAFQIKGIPHAKDMARIVRTIDLIRKRTESARHESMLMKEALEFYATLSPQLLEQSLRDILSIMPNKYCIDKCTLAGLYYCFAEKSPLQARVFFEVWATGSSPRAGAPFLLFQRLGAAVQGNGHSPSHQRLVIVVSAWNQFVLGRKFGLTDLTAALGRAEIPIVKGPYDI